MVREDKRGTSLTKIVKQKMLQALGATALEPHASSLLVSRRPSLPQPVIFMIAKRWFPVGNWPGLMEEGRIFNRMFPLSLSLVVCRRCETRSSHFNFLSSTRMHRERCFGNFSVYYRAEAICPAIVRPISRVVPDRTV